MKFILSGLMKYLCIFKSIHIHAAPQGKQNQTPVSKIPKQTLKMIRPMQVTFSLTLKSRQKIERNRFLRDGLSERW